jgi:hypothetical protein
LILFGADALAWTESQFSDHVLSAWRHHRSSLLHGLEPERVDGTEMPA